MIKNDTVSASRRNDGFCLFVQSATTLGLCILAFLPSPAACARNYDTDRPGGSEIFPADFQIFDPSGKKK